jgi:DNA topoisomerase-1
MVKGDLLHATDLQADGHETQPPARYTEATLVKTLEAREIGRPSTYASIISTIIDRGYVYERGRALIPSWLAFSVIKLLESKFPKYVDYQFTAQMENGLDMIAHGKESGQDWLTRFYFGGGEESAHSTDEAREGLQQQVAQLGEIDARAINTIEIGGGLQVRVGRYGPYLEDTVELDDDGNPKRASIPDTIAPDELTVAAGHELIANNAGGPRELGKDPKTGGSVEVRKGRFGPYVALVQAQDPAKESEQSTAADKPKKRAKKSTPDKPKMASLFKTMDPETLTLEDALRLLELPRTVGTLDEQDAESGKTTPSVVTANNGRYGPYLTKTAEGGGTDTRSLASEDEIFTVDIDKAKELFAQPKYGRRARGAAKPPLRELGPDPENGKNVTIKDGFYGAYITDGETNRTLPKQYSPESIEVAEAFRLLAEKRAAGPVKRKGRSTRKKSSTTASSRKTSKTARATKTSSKSTSRTTAKTSTKAKSSAKSKARSAAAKGDTATVSKRG